jgi:xylose isomerase
MFVEDRTYLIMKGKGQRWNADKEIQAILRELSGDGKSLPSTAKYSRKGLEALLVHSFDKDAILRKQLPYERLDQLTIDILTSVR